MGFAFSALAGLLGRYRRKSGLVKPDHEFQSGYQLYQRGQIDKAANIFRKLLEAHPDHFASLHLLGVIAQQKGDSRLAAQLIRQATILDPSNPYAFNNLGLAYQSLGHAEDAEECYHQALTLHPAFAEGLNNLGKLLIERGHFREAEHCFRRALEIRPDHVETLNNLGNILRELDSPAEAEKHLLRALELRPGDPSIKLNLAFLALSRGEFREGFALYDNRLDCPQNSSPGLPPVYDQIKNKRLAVWQGTPLNGKRLLIWSEQGIGDTLMFAGMFGEAIHMGGHCLILCDERLTDLIRRSFPAAEVHPLHTPLEKIKADCQIAAGSLARHFRACLADFPVCFGYLTASASSVTRWQHWLAGLGEGLYVGIAWRSGMRSPLRDRHYSELTEWREILAIPGVKFINLQYGEAEEELQEAETRPGIRIHRPPGLDLKNDLDEVAALMQALDLVISAGTAVAAMAGALGKETWMYTLRSSWIKLGTSHLPWMPSVTIHEKGWDENWSGVFRKMADDLKKRV